MLETHTNTNAHHIRRPAIAAISILFVFGFIFGIIFGALALCLYQPVPVPVLVLVPVPVSKPELTLAPQASSAPFKA